MRFQFSRVALLVCLTLVLSACGDSANQIDQQHSDQSGPTAQMKSGAQSSSSEQAPPPEIKKDSQQAKVINLRTINNSGPEDVANLAGLAGNSQLKPTLRVAALKQLAHHDQRRSVALCARLARNPGVKDPKHARLLQNNAIAILVRTENEHSSVSAADSQSGQDESLKESAHKVLEDLSNSIELRNIVLKLREHTKNSR